MNREHALKLRELILKASQTLSDDDALDGIELYPAWAYGTAYTQGDRVRYAGTLYKVNQTHTSQADWTPDATPALYTEVSPSGVIPVWRQPTGAQDAYNKGDRVHYPVADSPVYESLIDANVYSPDTYPAGWRLCDV